MNSTPKSNRIHISFFGNTNVGKSSLINAITGQEISIVSAVRGTTTDPVNKAMELLPIGPVLFTDTAGLNDNSELGLKRIEKSLKVIERSDLCVYVISAEELNGKSVDRIKIENHLKEFKKYNSPHILAISKTDLLDEMSLKEIKGEFTEAFFVSVEDPESVERFKNGIISRLENIEQDKPIVGDLLPYGSTVVLVVPIDSEAPKGRIILPQVQVIRDCLDHGIKTLVVRDTELEETISENKNVDMVITDSQVFKRVAEIVPPEIPLTGFSILFSRHKGELSTFMNGIRKLDELEDGSRIMMLETCTHNTSHEDIGKYKIPKLIREKLHKDVEFVYHYGPVPVNELDGIDLAIHCGACMINRKAMLSRLFVFNEMSIPITNYGMVLSHLNGILDRSVGFLKI